MYKNLLVSVKFKRRLTACVFILSVKSRVNAKRERAQKKRRDGVCMSMYVCIVCSMITHILQVSSLRTETLCVPKGEKTPYERNLCKHMAPEEFSV